MRMIVAVTPILLLLAPPLAAQQTTDTGADLRVTRAVVATGVEEREPIGVAESFSPDVEEVYFYTVFEGDFEELEVEHVWLWNDEEMARIPLSARGPRWRTWSVKRILPDWTGEWTVQVVGPDGVVLESAVFTIAATSAPAGG